MLNKYLILITFSISSLLAIFDFFIFKYNPVVAFYIHNGIAFFVGTGLIYLSYLLLNSKEKNYYINILVFISGTVMAIVHIVKLIIGKCS